MKLPNRQHEIMLLICDGFRDKEIAFKLGISIYTVRHHYARIQKKLGAANRENAVSIFERCFRI